jgi:hypothetical protein
VTSAGPDGFPPDNDDDISDEDLLYRRIHPSQMTPDANVDGWRVSSADWGDPTGNVSVYLQSTLAEDNVEPVEVLDGYPEHTLVAVTVRDARKLSFGVIRDPDEEDNHSRARAHCLLTGLKPGKPGKKAQRTPLASLSTIVEFRQPRQ